MRRLSLVLLLVCLFWGTGVRAQVPQPGRAPARTSILDHQKDLGLTPDQVKGIQGQIDKMKTTLSSAQAKDVQLKTQLQGLVQQNAPLPAIRAKLMESATLVVDTQMANLEASRAVNAILTKDQLKKWEAIRTGGAPPAPVPQAPAPAPAHHQ